MKVVCLQVLFVLRFLSLVTLAGGQPKAPLKCSTHCGSFTSEIVAKRVKSYRQTEPPCAKQAIILVTLNSRELCADPEAEWVKKIVGKLDQKKAISSPPAYEATLAAAPSPGRFEQLVDLITAPSQASAPTSLFQGTGTTVLQRVHVPPARTEASSGFPPATQDSTQLPASIHPTDKSLHPINVRSHPPVPASSSPSSALSSIQATPVPPQVTSVSTLSSTTALDKSPSVQTSGAASSSADALGTCPFDGSRPVGTQEPSDVSSFTSEAVPGLGRMWVTQDLPNTLPVLSSLSGSQMPFITPFLAVGGLMVFSVAVAVVWLSLTAAARREDMVQGLLYRTNRRQSNIYPMEVI